MIITFVSTDSPEPREVFECNFNVSEPTQKFSHAPQNTSSYSLKYNFSHVISAELLQKLTKTAAKHEKSQPSDVCDNWIWMVLFATTLHTSLDSFGLILHCKNLIGRTTLRWTWYFQQSLHNFACKLYENWYFLEVFEGLFNEKCVIFSTFWMQRCAKTVKNITFNATQYHQTSFYSVV